MPLVKNKLKASLKAFLLKVNSIEQKDKDAAIDAYCEQHEKDIYATIKSATIIIPPGLIQVMTSTGPATNVAPITLNNVIK